MPESNTWMFLFKLFIVLALGYFALKLTMRIIPNVVKSSVRQRKTLLWIRRIKVVYKPVTIVILTIVLVSINLYLYGMVWLLLVAVTFKYIRNYLSGVVFKLNPLTYEGVYIKLDHCEGELQRFLPFGVIIHTKTGEQFVHYTQIDPQGFLVFRKSGTALRKTLFCSDTYLKQDLKDALFLCPLVDYNHQPTVAHFREDGVYKIKLTLLNGVHQDQLFDYFLDKNISVNTQKTE